MASNSIRQQSVQQRFNFYRWIRSIVLRLSGAHGPICSEAVGGVIQIFTKDGSGKTSSHAQVGYGSYNTLTAGAGSTGFSDDSSYSLNVSYSDTDGIDSQTGAQPDKDGYDNASLAVRWTRYLDAENDLNVSCLLYTSPSPRDYAASRMPSSA